MRRGHRPRASDGSADAASPDHGDPAQRPRVAGKLRSVRAAPGLGESAAGIVPQRPRGDGGVLALKLGTAVPGGEPHVVVELAARAIFASADLSRSRTVERVTSRWTAIAR